MPQESFVAPLPRSVLLALWLNGAGSVPGLTAERITTAVEQDDEPHSLAGVPRETEWAAAPPQGLLRDALPDWFGGPLHAAALLPVPGDAAGVPAPVSARATEAGECLLLTISGEHVALVPEIEVFGSVLEQGFLVTWHAQSVQPWETRFLGAVGSLSEAERGLRRALRTATEALAGLDVARWRPDAAQAILALGSGAAVPWDLPPSFDQRQVQVLTLAARLRAIVELARDDDGGAVNLWQADQRSTALREVDHAARHAMAAATLPLVST